MLQTMRAGKGSIVLKLFFFGLLLMAMVGLAVMDVQGMFRSGVKQDYVAKIDGKKFSAQEFDRIVQQELQKRNIRSEEAFRVGLPQQILMREVNNRLLARAAHDLGLLIDDATVAAEIKRILLPLTEKGTPEPAALAHLLRTYGMSEGQLVGAIKAELASNALIQTVVSGGNEVPEQMVRDALKYRHETRRGEYFVLTAADGGKIAAPTEENLQAAYQAMAARFMQPETRTFAAVVVTPKALGAEIKVTDADIKTYYDAHADEFGTPEKRVISQLLVKDEESANKSAYAQTVGELKKLAEWNADHGMKFSTGTFTKADLPPELAEVAFNGKPGVVLEKVKSDFGWHLIVVDKVIPGNVRKFDSVKADIRTKLERQQGAEAVYAKANEIDDMIASGTPLSTIAGQYNLKETAFEQVTADKKIETTVPAFDKVMKNAFALDKGEVSQMIETPEGEFVIVETREITPSAPLPFEKVKDEVAKAWEVNQLAEALETKAATMTERLGMGESFDKIADSLGKKIQRTEMMKRDDKSAGKSLPNGFVTALFSIDKTGETITVPGEGSLFVLRLAERKIDMPQNPKQEDAEAVRNLLGRSLQNDLLEQYRQSLIAKYNVKINEDLLNAMYAPKTEENQ
jgi:peptidyl-prolyl cis-trans isomerase D